MLLVSQTTSCSTCLQKVSTHSDHFSSLLAATTNSTSDDNQQKPHSGNSGTK